MSTPKGSFDAADAVLFGLGAETHEISGLVPYDLPSHGSRTLLGVRLNTLTTRVQGDGKTLPNSGIEVHLSEEWLERPWKPVRHATVAKDEVTYLKEHLEEAHGNLAEVAQRAELNPRTLYDMMQRHGLNKESFRFRKS